VESSPPLAGFAQKKRLLRHKTEQTLHKTQQRPTVPQPYGCNIIGLDGLNFRVRADNRFRLPNYPLPDLPHLFRYDVIDQ
jgi:hypothetical protein